MLHDRIDVELSLAYLGVSFSHLVMVLLFVRTFNLSFSCLS